MSMRVLIAEVRSHLDKRRRLERLKDELFIHAVEYARLINCGTTLEDGCWILHNKTDGDRMAEYKLRELGAYSTRILREMTVVPLERNALFKQKSQSVVNRLKEWWSVYHSS